MVSMLSSQDMLRHACSYRRRAKRSLRLETQPFRRARERESGTSYDMLERIQKAKDYVEIGVDAEEYYRIMNRTEVTADATE